MSLIQLFRLRIWEMRLLKMPRLETGTRITVAYSMIFTHALYECEFDKLAKNGAHKGQ